jgi:hypothetical protein
LLHKDKKQKQKVGERDVYHKDYWLTPDGMFVLENKPEKQSIRVFENNDSILITAIPPPVLEEFLRQKIFKYFLNHFLLVQFCHTEKLKKN